MCSLVTKASSVRETMPLRQVDSRNARAASELRSGVGLVHRTRGGVEGNEGVEGRDLPERSLREIAYDPVWG